METDAANERRFRGGLGEKEDRRITDIRERTQRIEGELESIDCTETERRERPPSLAVLDVFVNTVP